MMLRSPISTRRTSKKSADLDGVNNVEASNGNKDTSKVASSSQPHINISASDPASDSGAAPASAIPHDNDGAFNNFCVAPGDVDGISAQGRTKVQKLDDTAYKPFGSRSRASSVGSDASFCKGGPDKACGEPVRSNECGVSCDMCERWFHASCQGIPKPAYDALTKYQVLAWLCPGCKATLKGIDAKNLSSLEAKVDQLSTSLDAHMRRIGQSLKEQEQAVVEQTQLLERSIRDSHTQKASYAEMVKGTCSDMVAKVSAKVSAIPQTLASQASSKDMQSLSQVFDEFIEKDRRKFNLVIHNLPESEGSTFAERMERDAKLFQEVIRDVFRLNVSVSKVFRVGKGMQTRPRLLIVTLHSSDVKGDILRLAPQLRSSDHWGNIYITPDLTKSEREALRKVREELATRRAAGEQNLVIRKGKVVQLRAVADQNREEVSRGGHSQNEAHLTGSSHSTGVRQSSSRSVEPSGLSCPQSTSDTGLNSPEVTRA